MALQATLQPTHMNTFYLYTPYTLLVMCFCFREATRCALAEDLCGCSFCSFRWSVGKRLQSLPDDKHLMTTTTWLQSLIPYHSHPFATAQLRRRRNRFSNNYHLVTINCTRTPVHYVARLRIAPSSCFEILLFINCKHMTARPKKSNMHSLSHKISSSC